MTHDYALTKVVMREKYFMCDEEGHFVDVGNALPGIFDANPAPTGAPPRDLGLIVSDMDESEQL